MKNAKYAGAAANVGASSQTDPSVRPYRWDADEYAKHSSAQFEWARELFAALNLRGDEALLDIGCGDGKITAELAARLPRGWSVGIDRSESMLALAHERFPPTQHANLAFILMDATRLGFAPVFDVVFSNAALHWIMDHPAVLRGVAAGLKRGGRVIFSMGGRGNARDVFPVLEEVMRRPEWQPYFRGFIFPYVFHGPEEYHTWLDEVGLRAERVELVPKDMRHKGKEGLAAWIRTTWLPYMERVPAELRDRFVSDVADAYVERHPLDAEGNLHVLMSRLEVHATKR